MPIIMKIRSTKREIRNRGYTLIELIVASGLFALIMTMISGAYLVMIGVTRHTQGMVSGIDNLSFAIETMARDIRTGYAYACNGSGDCPGGGSSFSFTNSAGQSVSYSLSGSAIQRTVNGIANPLTDATSVQITSLVFRVSGSGKPQQGDYAQPYATIIVSGSVAAPDPDDQPQSFTVETGAAMRGTDL